MVHYDPEFYRGKRVFVTGHTGFKGSWLCKMLLMAGAEVSAEEARDWGLVDRIVAPERLMRSAEALAADVLTASPEHVMAIKATIG